MCCVLLHFHEGKEAASSSSRSLPEQSVLSKICPACVQEQDVLRNLVVPCMLDPLPGREVEVDEFQVRALPRLGCTPWEAVAQA